MSAPPPPEQTSAYTHEPILVLTASGIRQSIRRRPAMYVGRLVPEGMHLLLWELFETAVFEHVAGRCHKIKVDLLPDRGCRVWFDSARPIGLLADLTLLAQFDPPAGHPRGDLEPLFTESWHGIGIHVTNVLSVRFEVKVSAGGTARRQNFRQGEPDPPGRRSRTSAGDFTTVTFWPDSEIFQAGVKFDWDLIGQRSRELSFLLPGLTIQLGDRRSARRRRKSYQSVGGIVDYLQCDLKIRGDHRAHAHPFFTEGKHGDLRWQAALLWSADEEEHLLSFANYNLTPEGGTHVHGVPAAITRVLKKHGADYGSLKDVPWTEEDCRVGLTGIVAVTLSQPQYRGATKACLANIEIAAIIEREVARDFALFLEANPDDACAIVARVIQACESRIGKRKRRGRKS